MAGRSAESTATVIRRIAAASITLAAAALAAALLLALVAAAPAGAVKGSMSAPWPPKPTKGILFAHFGEEHINDEDGGTLLPTVVRDVTRYEPNLVTMSSDKADDGQADQFQLWLDVMRRFDAAGVPWFSSMGNHDRTAPDGFETGVLPTAPGEVYREFFAPRPYPMGDGAPYDDPKLFPKSRLPGDEEGAATHYFADYGNVRWIFIDNSCWSIILCSSDGLSYDSGQSDAPDQDQFEFLAQAAGEARDRGMHSFVVMHMPTQDPGDQSYRETIAMQHTMGKTALGVADNSTFEQTAAEAGVDGVFLGHIKGQFRYRGQGNIPYFIDGGAGGELYTRGPVGVDHGYWHGYRLIHVRGKRWFTETVPIFVKNGIRIEGPWRLARGERATWAAFGRQPVFHDPAKVERFELRDPDPIPSGGARTGVAAIGTGMWGLIAAGMLGLLAVAWFYRGPVRGPLMVLMIFLAGSASAGGVSIAQRSEPTSTKAENLPTPSRIWTSSAPLVLAPVAAKNDDARRNARRQTDGGRFRGVCPGRATLEIASGFESKQRRIRVPSVNGKPIVRGIRARGGFVRRGRATGLARVRPGQPVRVIAKVLNRRGKPIATLKRTCTGRTTFIRWNGRRGLGRGKLVRPGAYTLVVKALSDRRPIRRTARITVG